MPSNFFGGPFFGGGFFGTGEISATVVVTLDDATLDARGTNSTTQPASTATGSGGQIRKRRARGYVPSFSVDLPRKPIAITARAEAVLEDATLYARAERGEPPGVRRRRRTLAILLS